MHSSLIVETANNREVCVCAGIQNLINVPAQILRIQIRADFLTNRLAINGDKRQENVDFSVIFTSLLHCLDYVVVDLIRFHPVLFFSFDFKRQKSANGYPKASANHLSRFHRAPMRDERISLNNKNRRRAIFNWPAKGLFF